jgi:anthranilate phosphoribosyltransferase
VEDPDEAAVAAHGGWPALLGAVAEGRHLSGDAAAAAMADVLAGRATPAQLAGLIVGLRAKGETVEELTGMVRAMLAAALPLHLPPGAVDLVGTGGSAHRRRHALNVSTMACFVVAGAGAVVCKHGNRRASSTSGSFDLLEALGVPIELSPAEVEACVAEVGLGFAFARTFHPAMRHAGPVRAELGIPTVFNVLGPLAHPGRVTRQVVGTSDPDLARTMAAVLAALGSERALVVVGDQGIDELTTTGPATVVEVVEGHVAAPTVVDPAELGLPRVTLGDLAGGDAAANAAIARRVLAGEGGPHRDVVVLNAAAGLVVAGLAPDLAAGVERAAGAIDDGSAAAVLARLVARTAARAQPDGPLSGPGSGAGAGPGA